MVESWAFEAAAVPAKKPLGWSLRQGFGGATYDKATLTSFPALQKSVSLTTTPNPLPAVYRSAAAYDSDATIPPLPIATPRSPPADRDASMVPPKKRLSTASAAGGGSSSTMLPAKKRPIVTAEDVFNSATKPIKSSGGGTKSKSSKKRPPPTETPSASAPASAAGAAKTKKRRSSTTKSTGKSTGERTALVPLVQTPHVDDDATSMRAPWTSPPDAPLLLEHHERHNPRSKRQRWRPLEYWKGERVVYEAPKDSPAPFARITSVLIRQTTE